MTTRGALLYRSPNVVIDAAVWHITVREVGRRRVVAYWFRLLTDDPRRVMWQPLSKWAGKLPKGMSRYFAPFHRSVQIARGINSPTPWQIKRRSERHATMQAKKRRALATGMAA